MKKLFEIINEFSKAAECKMNRQKSVSEIIFTNNEELGKEIKEFHYNSSKKTKIFGNNLN
jgi:hypothetical protein